MRVKEGNKERDILEAAVDIFAGHGFHKAKISQIAEQAGVATGSVYLYYKNKDDILIKIYNSLWEKLYNELLAITANEALSPIEKIDAMIDLIFDMFTENPSVAIVFVNEQENMNRISGDKYSLYYEKFLDEGEKVIKEGIRSGLFNKNIDLKIFRHFIFGSIRNLLHQWALTPDKLPLNKIRQNFKFLIKHGIMK